ncbi:hypothetical protein [Dipodfec virus UOA04_Rod_499]|nr:hypothetical protein [Dipodfec virus UOA04_Rod_499]
MIMKVLISVRTKALPNEIVEQFVCSLSDVSSFIEFSSLDKDHYIIVESLNEFVHE